MEKEMCRVDSYTTNTILREVRYFQALTKREGMVLTITRRNAIIVGSRKTTITLQMGTQIKSRKNYCIPIQHVPY
jgi:hypothetical protein